MSKIKGIYCYASPRGYGKTYYELEKLRQENQQLKEKRDVLVQRGNEYREKITDLEIKLDKYKSVLDEIREYINKNKYFYSGLQHEDLEIGLFEDEINDLLQILDKVKE